MVGRWRNHDDDIIKNVKKVRFADQQNIKFALASFLCRQCTLRREIS